MSLSAQLGTAQLGLAQLGQYFVGSVFLGIPLTGDGAPVKEKKKKKKKRKRAKLNQSDSPKPAVKRRNLPSLRPIQPVNPLAIPEATTEALVSAIATEERRKLFRTLAVERTKKAVEEKAKRQLAEEDELIAVL